MSKSTMFCSNLSDAIKNEILGIVLFNVGKLPVRYLGVPLVTRRLSVKDCKSLVEKVKGKTYWASVFFIPNTTIKEIDSILNSFLWSQWKRLMVKLKLLGKMLKGRNLWEIPNDDNASSWRWRKIMDLRD
ncbi:hypothetical protein Tco_0117813 [Tanacetum coccineum]